MSGLEERIAEAVRGVADNRAHGGGYWLNLARAVVAELGMRREVRVILGDTEERFVTDWRPIP